MDKENFMNKYVIFASRRTGSSILQQILWQYFKKYANCQKSLIEFFNVKLSNKYLTDFYDGEKILTTKWSDDKKDNSYQLLVRDSGTDIKYFKDYKNINKFDTKRTENTEIIRRLELIKKYNSTFYLNKIFSNHLLPEVFDYYNDNYAFICLERKNKFDQVLSYGILAHLQTGFVKNNYQPEINEEEIVMIYPNFKMIENCILSFYEFLPKIKNKQMISYEDIIEAKNKMDLLKFLGFVVDKSFRLDETVMNTPLKFNDKKILFKNLDEIKGWYIKSPLQNIYRIKNET